MRTKTDILDALIAETFTLRAVGRALIDATEEIVFESEKMRATIESPNELTVQQLDYVTAAITQLHCELGTLVLRRTEGKAT